MAMEGSRTDKTRLAGDSDGSARGMVIAGWGPVTNTKQLMRDALAGFLLGVLVVSTVALVTWQTRPASAETR